MKTQDEVITVSRDEIEKLWALYRAFCHEQSYSKKPQSINAASFLGWADSLARNALTLHTEYNEQKI